MSVLSRYPFMWPAFHHGNNEKGVTYIHLALERTVITRQGSNGPALANTVVRQAVGGKLASRFTRHRRGVLRLFPRSPCYKSSNHPQLSSRSQAKLSKALNPIRSLSSTSDTSGTSKMGYRSERDKDGNKIPRERSGKPRRHRGDRLDLSQQTGTPVYPPPNSVYSHAQPFYLPYKQNTSKPGSVPVTAQSGPHVAPSDTPHPPPANSRSSRPATSQEDRRTTKAMSAKVPPPVKDPISVGHTGTSMASTGTSCSPVPLAGTRGPITDSHRIKSTHAPIRDALIDPQKVADSRKPSSAATPRKPVMSQSKGGRKLVLVHHRKDGKIEVRDSREFRNVKGTQAANRKSAWGGPVEDPFTDLHSVSATRPSSSAASRALKQDTSRRMPGAIPKPDTHHSSPLSAVSSIATLHAPFPTHPQTRRPVIPSAHPFRHAKDSSAGSEASPNPRKGISPHHPLPLPGHLTPQPSRSSTSSSSVSRNSDTAQMKSVSQVLSSSRASTSSPTSDRDDRSAASSPPPPYSPYPPLLRYSSARAELEQNPWISSPSPPIVRRSSLKGATPVRTQRQKFGFADEDEVRTYGEDDAPNKMRR